MRAINTLPGSERLANSAQCLSERRLDPGQRKVPPARSRDDGQVARHGKCATVEAIRLAKEPLDAVAPHRAAMPFSHAEAQARMRQPVRQGPDGELSKLESAPLAKNAVEVPLQPNMLLRSKPVAHLFSSPRRAVLPADSPPSARQACPSPAGRPRRGLLPSTPAMSRALPQGNATGAASCAAGSRCPPRSVRCMRCRQRSSAP